MTDLDQFTQRAERIGQTAEKIMRDAADFGVSAQERLEELEARAARSPEEQLDEANRMLYLEGDDAITAFYDESGDDGGYIIEGRRGRAHLTPTQLTRFRDARPKILAATGSLVPTMQASRWDPVVNTLLRAATKIDLGDEATDRGTAFAWLTEYLQNRPLAIVDDEHVSLDQVAETMTPYTTDGVTYVFGPHFRRWLHTSRGDRVTAARMGQVLNAAGCEAGKINVKINGVRTSRQVWRVPDLNAQHHDELLHLVEAATP